MNEDDKKSRRVKTTPFRMSFPFILEPRENDKGDNKYELNMLFPPGFDRAPFMAAFKSAAVDKWGADKSKWPKLRHKPDDCFIDFAEFNGEARKPLPGDWAGWTLVRARATEKNPPGVVGNIKGSDGKFPTVTDAREVYGGRWARATLEAFTFERKDGSGVSLGLANVQLLKHDTKFGNAVTAPEKDFDDDVSPEWRGEADEFDKGAEATAEDNGW